MGRDYFLAREIRKKVNLRSEGTQSYETCVELWWAAVSCDEQLCVVLWSGAKTACQKRVAALWILVINHDAGLSLIWNGVCYYIWNRDLVVQLSYGSSQLYCTVRLYSFCIEKGHLAVWPICYEAIKRTVIKSSLLSYPALPLLLDSAATRVWYSFIVKILY